MSQEKDINKDKGKIKKPILQIWNNMEEKGNFADMAANYWNPQKILHKIENSLAVAKQKPLTVKNIENFDIDSVGKGLPRKSLENSVPKTECLRLLQSNLLKVQLDCLYVL